MPQTKLPSFSTNHLLVILRVVNSPSRFPLPFYENQKSLFFGVPNGQPWDMMFPNRAMHPNVFSFCPVELLQCFQQPFYLCCPETYCRPEPSPILAYPYASFLLPTNPTFKDFLSITRNFLVGEGTMASSHPTIFASISSTWQLSLSNFYFILYLYMYLSLIELCLLVLVSLPYIYTCNVRHVSVSTYS